MQVGQTVIAVRDIDDMVIFGEDDFAGYFYPKGTEGKVVYVSPSSIEVRLNDPVTSFLYEQSSFEVKNEPSET